MSVRKLNKKYCYKLNDGSEEAAVIITKLKVKQLREIGSIAEQAEDDDNFRWTILDKLIKNGYYKMKGQNKGIAKTIKSPYTDKKLAWINLREVDLFV